MERPIQTPLPADLPVNWQTYQIVSPDGVSVGLDEKHGYNYQAEQVNAAQRGVNALNEAFDRAAALDHKHTAAEVGALPLAGDIDCGHFDEETGAVSLHDASPIAHQLMEVDGNATEASKAAESLEEHMADPLAHRNIILDGNLN